MAESLHPRNNIADQNKRTFSGEMKDLIDATDWSKTSAGAMENWPQCLKATIKTMLGSRYPMVILWGGDLIQIYNDAYTELIGSKHPDALGKSIRETQAESWDAIGPMIQEVMTTGTPNWVPAQMLKVNRAGFPEETYFSLSYSALEDDESQIKGMLCVCSEVTQQVLGERRLKIQLGISSKAADARTTAKVFEDVTTTLRDYPFDVPFALLYLRDNDSVLNLGCTVAIDDDHPSCSNKMDFRSGGFDPWSLRRVMKGETVHIKEVNKIVSLRGGAWNDEVMEAICLPVPSPLNNSPLGVLVAGISPNQPFNMAYCSFYELLAGQISVALRNAFAFEEEHLHARAISKTEPGPAPSRDSINYDRDTHIMLVDDNAVMLEYLKQIISSCWSVETAMDGLEALSAARHRPPHLIISDVMMPKMNGFELLSEIRQDPVLSHIPLILLSGRAGEEALLEGLESGASDYLVKPFSAPELLARVRTQLEINRTRQANDQLRKTQEELRKFKTISDYAYDAFILMREDGSFAYLNDLALKRWGYTREEVQKIRVPDVDPLYQEKEYAGLFATAQKQFIPPFETVHKKKDGTTFPVEVSVGSITLDGKPHVFAVARDITERKLSEEMLKARNEELQKINNDLDNFIYTASHDLKAPITNIEGLMHLLVKNLPKENLESPVTEKVITLIRTSISRFRNTINDLTELSKLQRSAEEEESLIFFEEMYEEVCLDLEAAIQESRAKIEADFSQAPEIRFSRKNLRSIIYNLISNAIKYRSPERTPFVRVSSQAGEEGCLLLVRDNGLGIDLSQENKVFSMFKRLHDHVEGSGIGLYIVKKIIENSGGKIMLESVVGKGSTFKVYFNQK